MRRQKQREATSARRLAAKEQAGRMVGYVRVSTEDQGDVGVGLEAQRQAIEAACAARKWVLVGICEDVASDRLV